MQKHAKRLEGDPLADELFISLKESPSVYKELLDISSNKELLLFTSDKSAFSGLDWSQKDLPEQLAGHTFFETYTEPILTILGLYSLPYCYAGANGARVLIQSKKIVENPKVRLMETAQFVFDVCERNAFQPSGKGLVSILKVRLMHAAARYYASRSIKDEVPVNQEDMLGTLLSFSLLVIRGLRKLGVNVSQSGADHYHALWCQIGELMGVNPEHIPRSIKSASVLERQIRVREFRKSEEGVLLTDALLDYFQSFKAQMQGIEPSDLMRLLLGDEIADYLNLPNAAKIKLEALSIAMKAQNFYKNFSTLHYQGLVRTFELNLRQENVTPQFKASLE